jgi:asparagine synthetase B (glutamine-hydrolysing)
MLSGGIDSSILWKLHSKDGPNKNINSYTFYYKDGLSEFEAAREINPNTIGIELNKEEYNTFINEYIQYIDAPTGDAAEISLAYLISKVPIEVKVLISGDGADEIFGGYIKHRFCFFTSKIFIEFLHKFNSKVLSVFSLRPELRGLYLGSGGFNIKDVMKMTNLTFRELNELLNEYLQKLDTNNYLKISNEMNADVNSQLPFWYMRKSDRASMFSSKELRSPFLSKLLYLSVSQNKYKSTGTPYT